MEITAEDLLGALAKAVNQSRFNESNAMPYGFDSEMTWTDWKEKIKTGVINPNQVLVQNKESSSLGAVPAARLYTCTGLFGLCGPDDIVGLSMKDDPLVAWLGFVADTICEKSIKVWTYFDQQGTAAGSVVGTVYGDACDTPPISEKSQYEYFIGDFGTLRGCGETVNVSEIGLRKCDKQPTYTIPVEGVGPIKINNDLDLETIAASQMVKHELSRLIITGDKTVTGQFDGLSNLVKTGYFDVRGERIFSADSVVTDWQNDNLDGAVNGHGSIITKVRDMWRQIRWRIDQTRIGMPREGDVVLAMPTWLSWLFLDEWAFWSFKEQTSAGDQVVYRDVYELRNFRDRFNGGLFGAGFITIDGFNIHIMPHDWAPISQDAPNFCSDIYLLTRQIGPRRVLQGQYIPSDAGVSAVASQAGYNYFNVESIQGGRGLKWLKFLEACVSPCVLFRPRIYLDAPWAQGRIENVCVNPQFAPMSPDPQSNYFIESNKVASTPITQYWYSEGTWFQ